MPYKLNQLFRMTPPDPTPTIWEAPDGYEVRAAGGLVVSWDFGLQCAEDSTIANPVLVPGRFWLSYGFQFTQGTYTYGNEGAGASAMTGVFDPAKVSLKIFGDESDRHSIIHAGTYEAVNDVSRPRAITGGLVPLAVSAVQLRSDGKMVFGQLAYDATSRPNLMTFQMKGGADVPLPSPRRVPVQNQVSIPPDPPGETYYDIPILARVVGLGGA